MFLQPLFHFPFLRLCEMSSLKLTPFQGSASKSNEKIPKGLDRALDRAIPSNDHVAPGISLANGPMEAMELDEPRVKDSKSNGVANGKRKARQVVKNGPNNKDATSEFEDDKPSVCRTHRYLTSGSQFADVDRVNDVVCQPRSPK